MFPTFIRRRHAGHLFALLVACKSDPVEVTAATDDTGEAPGFGCVPGQELPCSCANGWSGTQVCLGSGYEAGACKCEAGSTTDGGASTSTGTSTGDLPLAETTAATTASDSTTTGDETTDGGSTGDPVPVCGNHIVEPGEQCDDGNVDYTDACHDCIASCGIMWSQVFGEGRGVDVDVTPGRVHVLVDTPDRLGAARLDELDPSGNVLWSATVEPLDLQPRAVAGGPSDGAIAIALAGDGASGQVLLFESESDIRWSNAQDFEPAGVAIDGAGNVWVSGLTREMDETTPRVRKLDAAGDEVWSAIPSGLESRGGAHRLAVDGNGDGYVLVALNETEPGVADAVSLVKLANESGQPVWSAGLAPEGATGPHRAIDVAVDGALGVVTLVARVDATGRDQPFWVTSHDLDGMAWGSVSSADLAQRSPRIPAGFGVDDQGGLGIAGADRAEGREDAFTLRLNSRGAPTCSSRFALGGSVLTPTSVAVDTAGNMFVTGGLNRGRGDGAWVARFRF